MTFVISLATTPTRINNFIYSITYFNKELPDDCIKVVINIASSYKRFPDSIKLSDYSKKILLENKKFILNIIPDYGPISKYYGGIDYISKNNLHNCSLFIIDDDIMYNKKYIEEVIRGGPYKLISAGNGFDIINNQYTITTPNPQYIEGFSGIYFNYNNVDKLLQKFIKYYSCLIKKKDEEGAEDNIINNFLIAAFMGDDFIISSFYKNKIFVNGKNLFNYHKCRVMEYGLGTDALQNNQLFGSNMDTYFYLRDNEIILTTFINKLKVNTELMSACGDGDRHFMNLSN